MMETTLSKEIMEQYKNIKEEIESIKEDIKRTEDSISKLLEEGTVCDKVTGGLGGLQGFKIEGFPVAVYEKRRKLLRNKMDRLRKKENDLIECSESIESFIDSIPNSRDRRIFRYRYICGMSQQQIADKLYIDRSLVSKIISRYM